MFSPRGQRYFYKEMCLIVAIRKKTCRLPSFMVAPPGREKITAAVRWLFRCENTFDFVGGRGGGGEEVDVVGIHLIFEIVLIRSFLGFYNYFYVFSFIRIYLFILLYYLFYLFIYFILFYFLFLLFIYLLRFLFIYIYLFI